MPSLLSSRGANVAIELDSIFVSGKYRESGFNRDDKMNFLFFSQSMRKLDSNSKFYANVILLMIFIE